MQLRQCQSEKQLLLLLSLFDVSHFGRPSVQCVFCSFVSLKFTVFAASIQLRYTLWTRWRVLEKIDLSESRSRCPSGINFYPFDA